MKRIIACDLFTDLNLYRIPSKYQLELERRFPNFAIVPVNTPGNPLIIEDAEIYWGNRIKAKMLDAMPRLKWIHFGSIGIGDIRNSNASEKKIIVTNSKGTSEKAVALTALSFLLSLARGLKIASEISSVDEFSREGFDFYFDSVFDFSEHYNVLILGYGEIGGLLGGYFSCLGIQYDIVVEDNQKERRGNFNNIYELGDLESIINKYDAIINILPLTNLTKGVFDCAKFSRMKPTSFFINVGRGETVVECDLIKAIKSKKIAGAGLDVFENEPLDNKSELLKLSNVLITPILRLCQILTGQRKLKFFQIIWSYLLRVFN
ncbi:NAD(P)-dependent oxidoreductase [Leptospira noguchii]|uniref:NAD(P)-dependent oxidoreductase n=1 Tax=Leptospira noguchii TaxID=28182 RepID=UPI001FB699DE|nr:NAD(P)-dependent oxidoreductase [Leptospira noguchii]UOG35384.1 hypothetical protein MAL02_06730 [Leptospira noguchii]